MRGYVQSSSMKKYVKIVFLEQAKQQIKCWDQNSMKHLPSPYVLLGDIGLKIYQHFDKVKSISLDQNSQHISARQASKNYSCSLNLLSLLLTSVVKF